MKNRISVIAIIVIVLITQFVFISTSVSSRGKEETNIGYPFYYSAISTDGFFQMKSDTKGVSEFRDIKTGRLLHSIEHKDDFQPRICFNKYILTDVRRIDSDTATYEMIDRDGNKIEHTKYYWSETLLFKEKYIEIIETTSTDGMEVTLERVNEKKEVLWGKTFRGQRIYSRNSIQNYLWVFDFNDNYTIILNPASGDILYTLDFHVELVISNGNIAFCKGFDGKSLRLSVVDLDSMNTIWSEENLHYLNSYITDDTVNILCGIIPRNSLEPFPLQLLVIEKGLGIKESFTATFPSAYSFDALGFFDSSRNYICYQSPLRGSLALKDAKTDMVVWESEEGVGCKSATFTDDYLLISTVKFVELLDLNTFSLLWRLDTTSGFTITEFDGLEYIGMDDAIKVRDTKFDTIEPYEYDISFLGRYGHAEFIPTKHGLLAVPDVSSNNSFNEIRLMRPGVDEPVYSVYMSTGYMSEWERMDDANFIKLTWSYGSAYEDTVWYLHIPTGNCSLELPDEQ